MVNRLRAVKVIKGVRTLAAVKADSKVASRVANKVALNKADNRTANLYFDKGEVSRCHDGSDHFATVDRSRYKRHQHVIDR